MAMTRRKRRLTGLSDDTNGTSRFKYDGPLYPDPDTSLDGIAYFTRGTLISTLRGDIPIERLEEGDKIITRAVGALALRWVGSRRVRATGAMAPVMIEAGTLGNHTDLVVSPQLRIFVQSPKADLMFNSSEVLVLVRYLVFLSWSGIWSMATPSAVWTLTR